jgi:hypothetical protein
LGSIRTESKPKPSPLVDELHEHPDEILLDKMRAGVKGRTQHEDDIVELKPPADSGFSGTAKFYAVAQAAMIEELIKRGYTRVVPA